MNNLKKTVAIVIALAMVLSMGVATSFAAFSDVPSTVNYAEAVNILSNLGIINGYEDGTFKPDNTITRAEVATIMVNALGYGETNGETVFSDVPADHWAAGYINTAYNNGIISGMGDGTFAPGANVTYEQVVRMIVSALGYTTLANQRGGYPTGYLSVASSNQITAGAVGRVGDPATRATVAKLLYNSLETPMADTVEWGLTADKMMYGPNEDVTLLNNLGVEKWDAFVTDTYLNSDTYTSRDKSITLVTSKKYNDIKNSAYANGDLEKGYALGDFDEGGTAAASLLGQSVTAYIGEDPDTGVDTIFAISAKGNRNTIVNVKGDMFADGDADKDDRVYYWRNSRSDDNKPGQLTLDPKVKVYENYLAGTEIDVAEGAALTQEFFDYFKDNGGNARFIDNDGDGDYDYVMANRYTAESVLEEIEEDNGEWNFTSMSNGTDIEDYDEDDDDSLTLFIKGENYINVSELAPGDTVTSIKCDNGVTLNYVSSTVVEGTTRGYNSADKTVTINGTEYAVSPEEISGINVTDIKNKEGVFYINADGLVAYYDASATVGGQFGYVTYIGATTNYNRSTYEIELVDAQGTRQVYTLASSVRYYSQGDNYEKMNDELVPDALNDLINGGNEYRVIRYTVSGNQVNKIVTAESDEFALNSVSATRAYDAEEMSIGGVTFNNATVVFAVDADEDEDYEDPKNITVGNVARYFVDKNTYEAYAYGEDDILAALVINPATAIDQSNNVFVVSGTSIDYIDDEVAIEVTGYTGGRQETFTLYDEDGVADDYFDDRNDRSTLVKGTVLMKGEPVGEYVEDIEVIAWTSVEENSNGALELVIEEPVWDNDAEHDFTDRTNRVVQDIVTIDQTATDDVDRDRVVFDNYLDTADGVSYAPHSKTIITVVDATDSVRINRVSVSSRKSANALHLDLDDEEDGIMGYVYFRAYDVGSGRFDIQEERSNVTDLVLYKYPNGGAAPSSYSGRVQDYDDEEVIDDTVDEVIDDTVDDSFEGEIIDDIIE